MIDGDEGRVATTERSAALPPPFSRWLPVAALIGAVAVLLGAYHAHGLERSLTARALPPEDVTERLEQFGVGVRYHFYHALALLAVGVLDSLRPRRRWHVAAGLLLLGTLMFSGGLYALALIGPVLHWSVVPLGGLTMTAGWLALIGSTRR